MSMLYAPHPLRRLHQLHGTNGISQVWAPGGQLNFKFDDIPNTLVCLGRKQVNYVAAIRLNFEGSLISTAGVTIPRKLLTPMLIQAVQIQGTEIGSPVSFTHMLGGAIDTDTYIRKGCRQDLFNPPNLVLAAGVSQNYNYSLDIMLGNFAQAKGHQTCPLALFLQPGEIIINTPPTLLGVDASLYDTTLTLRVTAHAVLIPSSEILIANPWQMTRHKASVGAGTDSIMLSSFGASSTLTGVQSKAGIHSLLWAGDGLVGAAKGSGLVSSITQFGADFLGLRQNNDPRAIVQEMYSQISSGETNNGDLTSSNGLYPLFDLTASPNDIMACAEYFPILHPVSDFDASKLFEATGNPSFDITGTFTGPAHYTYMEGCYPFTMDALNSLLAVIQRSHIGQEIFQTDDLVLSTKMATEKAAITQAAEDPQKLVYLPRIVVPRANPAVK